MLDSDELASKHIQLEDRTVKLRGFMKTRKRRTGRKRQRFQNINGVSASKIQIRLAKSLGGEVNYKPPGLSFYIDIAFPAIKLNNGTTGKIGIEVDSWLYHKNKLSKDRIRARRLEQDGWRMLSIKFAKNMPSKAKVLVALEELKGDKTYIELKTTCWLNAEDVRRNK